MKTESKTVQNTSAIPDTKLILEVLPATLGILTEAAGTRHCSVREVAEDFLNSGALCGWQGDGFPA